MVFIPCVDLVKVYIAGTGKAKVAGHPFPILLTIIVINHLAVRIMKIDSVASQSFFVFAPMECGSFH